MASVNKRNSAKFPFYCVHCDAAITTQPKKNTPQHLRSLNETTGSKGSEAAGPRAQGPAPGARGRSRGHAGWPFPNLSRPCPCPHPRPAPIRSSCSSLLMLPFSSPGQQELNTFFFLLFRAVPAAHGRSPATCATHTTDHSTAGSLTTEQARDHLTSSGIRVGFVTAEPRRERQTLSFKLKKSDFQYCVNFIYLFFHLFAFS